MDCFIANDEILKGEKMVEDYKLSCACACTFVLVLAVL